MTTHTPISAERDHGLAPFAFQARPMADITTLAAGLAARSAPIDSFLEDHILSAQFFAIINADTGQPLGHAAIHEGKRLTQYDLQPVVRRYGQEIYRELV